MQFVLTIAVCLDLNRFFISYTLQMCANKWHTYCKCISVTGSSKPYMYTVKIWVLLQKYMGVMKALISSVKVMQPHLLGALHCMEMPQHFHVRILWRHHSWECIITGPIVIHNTLKWHVQPHSL